MQLTYCTAFTGGVAGGPDVRFPFFAIRPRVVPRTPVEEAKRVHLPHMYGACSRSARAALHLQDIHACSLAKSVRTYTM